MSYTRPTGDAIELRVSGSYSRPTGDAIELRTPIEGIAATIAAAVPVAAGLDAAHGVAGSGVGAVAVSASVEIEHTVLNFTVDIAAAVPVTAGADAVHGVSAGLSAVLPVSAGVGAAHGVAGTGAATVAAVAAIVGQVTRYEVAGEVRIGGALVDRRVRVYSRDTGAMIAQGDTVAGLFRVHAGFAADEVLVLPVDLSPSATDWSPPAANRVVPALAMDA